MLGMRPDFSGVRQQLKERGVGDTEIDEWQQEIMEYQPNNEKKNLHINFFMKKYLDNNPDHDAETISSIWRRWYGL